MGTAAAQKASVPKAQDKLALGEDEVRQLLVLMDTDNNGKVSKEQYMKFMEAEFARLDRNNTGKLDVKELTKSTITANRFVGK
jgi:Ca2+-binding EF-hand superfamily protein